MCQDHWHFQHAMATPEALKAMLAAHGSKANGRISDIGVARQNASRRALV
jgi:hypothetical protein